MYGRVDVEIEAFSLTEAQICASKLGRFLLAETNNYARQVNDEQNQNTLLKKMLSNMQVAVNMLEHAKQLMKKCIFEATITKERNKFLESQISATFAAIVLHIESLIISKKFVKHDDSNENADGMEGSSFLTN